MKAITSVKYWKCPECGELLEKGMLERGIVHPGDDADRIVGASTCSRCGHRYPQPAVYGGTYDFVGDLPSDEAPSDRVPTVASVVVFREGERPPDDPSDYCARVLCDRYGRDVIVRGWRLVGRTDRPTSSAIGALYSALRAEGQLPDYGHPSDDFEVEGPDGHHVAALTFWHEFAKVPQPSAVSRKRRWFRRHGT